MIMVRNIKPANNHLLYDKWLDDEAYISSFNHRGPKDHVGLKENG